MAITTKYEQTGDYGTKFIVEENGKTIFSFDDTYCYECPEDMSIGRDLGRFTNFISKLVDRINNNENS